MNTGSRESYTKDVEVDVTIYLEEDEVFATIKGEIEIEYDDVHDVIGTQIGDKHEYYVKTSEDDIEDDIITLAELTTNNRISRLILKQIVKKIVDKITDEDMSEDFSISYEIDIPTYIKTERL